MVGQLGVIKISLNTFSSGVNTSFSTELNENFIGNKIQQIYLGTDFDTSQAGSGTDSQEHELTSISSTSLGSSDYLRITLLLNVTAKRYDPDATNNLRNYIQIQTKDIGGSYSDSLAKTTLKQLTMVDQSDYVFINDISLVSITWYHTLTTDEKNNGVQVKILAESVADGATSNLAKVTNVQTVVSTQI